MGAFIILKVQAGRRWRERVVRLTGRGARRVLNTYVLIIFHMPGPLLGTGDSVMSNTDMASAFRELTI